MSGETEPDRYRDTSRVGPCIHCQRTTVRECVPCAQFVCDRCGQEHEEGCRGRQR